jgi:hypothetical protein
MSISLVVQHFPSRAAPVEAQIWTQDLWFWYHARQPLLINSTIKPRWYRRGESAFYPQSNISPTMCESRPHGSCAYSVESHHMDFSIVGVELISVAWNVWPNGIETRTSALIPSWRISASLTIKLRWYKRGKRVFYPQSNILPTVCEPRPHAQAMCVLNRVPLYGLLASEGRITRSEKYVIEGGLNPEPCLWYQVGGPLSVRL